MNTKPLALALLLLALLLSACQPPSPTVIAPILPTAEPTGTAKVEPTNTATLLPTSTTDPSPTPSPIPTQEKSRYTSERYGVSFKVPEGLEQVGEDHFEGGTRFITIEPFESVANYVSRACDWEANLHPEKYGLRPQLELESFFPEFVIASCTLIPAPDAADPTVQIFFRSFQMTEKPKLAVLRMDPESAGLVQRTFQLIFPEGDAPDPEPDLRLVSTVFPFAGPTTQEVSGFTFSKWQGLQEKLDELRMQGLEKVPSLNTDRFLNEHNTVLARFGYRLEEKPGPNGSTSYDLYQGEQLVEDNLGIGFWPIRASENDFSLVMEDLEARMGSGMVNFRKSGMAGNTDYDLDLHFWMPPLFVGDTLLTVEKETDGSTTRAVVKQEGKAVYTYSSSMYDYERTLVRSFDAWDGHWVMNANNTLIIDGENINTKLGYGEIFDWQIFEGQPWFFFEKDGRYGISYAGEELPIIFEHIPHLGCCGGWHNPSGSENWGHHGWISFFAWEDGAYSYYEVRK